MAKAKAAAAPEPKKGKPAKPTKVVAKAAPVKVKKKKKAAKVKPDKGIDTLWKLAEHPLVSELLAIGATAAVAAIAEQSIKETSKGKGKKNQASKVALKAAGTAAAAAIGQRLISEFADVKKAKPAKR